MTDLTDPSAVCTLIAGMDAEDVGALLGFKGQRAKNRGLFVKSVANKILEHGKRPVLSAAKHVRQ
ncbi:hypothetical protein [Brevundimonas sp. EYE_349]|uniref:hypothetical protein n=1 Tax=Brevundimonas sp. EYE_349 TaxID=2853455 RepID=UPI00200566A9|nr:hypothetical protein [Brevundimonas sp. EYE_349]MCK6106058.1 hypothetical protein [Brevundimonas sp. EYE_349]